MFWVHSNICGLYKETKEVSTPGENTEMDQSVGDENIKAACVSLVCKSIAALVMFIER